ncbi:hypothetical protein AAG906_000144 [Vitis piasezkii]
MEENAAEAKCRDVEQENDHLKKELEELLTGFATQKKKLEDEYQKQVDDIYPSDDEDTVADISTQGDEVSSIADPSVGQ